MYYSSENSLIDHVFLRTLRKFTGKNILFYMNEIMNYELIYKTMFIKIFNSANIPGIYVYVISLLFCSNCKAF